MLPYTGAETLRLFNHNLSQFENFRSAKVAPKDLIIQSVDDQYIGHLKNAITMYATVTPLELLKHL